MPEIFHNLKGRADNVGDKEKERWEYKFDTGIVYNVCAPNLECSHNLSSLQQGKDRGFLPVSRLLPMIVSGLTQSEKRK